jgi:hypothetical protein
MRKFIIEREIPNIGAADGNAIREVARKSNGIVEGFGGGIEWLESFITGASTARTSRGTKRSSASTRRRAASPRTASSR